MKTFVTRAIPLALLCAAATAHAQTQTKPPAAVAPQAKTKIDPRTTQEMVNTVLRETSAVRGLSILRPVPAGVKSQKAVEAMFEAKDKDEPASDEIVAAELFLRQLGLAPKDFDLRRCYVGMMGEQVAGFYDTRAKKFYTVDRVDPLQLRTIMAHELTHALQDQHYDLSQLSNWPRHDSDAREALKALVEGDASFTMGKYMMRNPFRALGVMTSSLKAEANSKVYNASPRLLRESLVFPYREGMQFVERLYELNGWSEVSAAFQDWPQSTEQILHMEKYILAEPPIEVKLRDLTPQLGKGWTLLDHDVNGEAGLALVVGEHLPDRALAARAAAGWGGDRYTVYRGPKSGVLVVQDCVWDTEQDALEWVQTYAKSTNNRFKFKPQQRGPLQVWNAAPNGVWMERHGRRVVILEGTVGAFNPTPLLKVLWK